MSLSAWWWEWIESLKRQSHRRLGRYKGDKLLALLTTWSWVENELGRPPTLEEFQQHSHISDAKAAEYMSIFAEAFPDYPSPSELNHVLETAAKHGTPTLFAGF
jgi:hypothetical protein